MGKTIEPYVREFLEAVYPDSAELAMCMFDEEHALTSATAIIKHYEAALREILVSDCNVCAGIARKALEAE